MQGLGLRFLGLGWWLHEGAMVLFSKVWLHPGLAHPLGISYNLKLQRLHILEICSTESFSRTELLKKLNFLGFRLFGGL